MISPLPTPFLSPLPTPLPSILPTPFTTPVGEPTIVTIAHMTASSGGLSLLTIVLIAAVLIAVTIFVWRMKGE